MEPLQKVKSIGVKTWIGAGSRDKGSRPTNLPTVLEKENQDRPPDGPRSSTATIFKNGSMIDRLRSSDIRRSFSLGGSGAEAEISTSEKIDARAVSTACRRAIESF